MPGLLNGGAARKRADESRDTSPRPTVLEESDGSVLESGPFQNATSLEMRASSSTTCSMLGLSATSSGSAHDLERTLGSEGKSPNTDAPLGAPTIV